MSSRTRLIALGAATALAVVATGTGTAWAATSSVSGSSQATAQSLYTNLLSNAAVLQVSNPALEATSDGSGSPDVVTSAPNVDLLSGLSGVSVGALSEYAAADPDGDSYACAGTVQPGGAVTVGTSGTACTDTGSGTGGVTIDLSELPGLGSALSGLSDVTLHLDAVTAFASDTLDPSGAATETGTGAPTGGSVSLSLLGQTFTSSLSIPSGVDANLLPTVVSGIDSDISQALAVPAIGTVLSGVLTPLLSTLSDTLKPLISLETNYQTTPKSGELSVTGLHVTLASGAGAVLDLGTVAVGPNAEVNVSPAFPPAGLPIAGGLGLAGLAVLGLAWRRRSLVFWRRSAA